MKRILILCSLLIIFKVQAQNTEVDTLRPFNQKKVEGGLYRISFDNTNIPLFTDSKTILKDINTAKRSGNPLKVKYDNTTNKIISIKTIELSKTEKFLQKFDTLSFVKFNYNGAKSLKFNQTHFLDQIEIANASLAQEIPLDSVKIIFEYFQQLSCSLNPVCHKEPVCITFDYKINGCNARAHWMKKILEEQFHYACQKIFTEGNLIALNDGTCGGNCVSWAWHVALLVQTNDASGKKGELVIDPSLFSMAVSRNDWIAAQEKVCAKTSKKGTVETVSVKSDDTYTPNGSTDLAYKDTKKLLYKFCSKCH